MKQETLRRSSVRKEVMLCNVYFEFLERAESCEAGSHWQKKKKENCSLDTYQQSRQMFHATDIQIIK